MSETIALTMREFIKRTGLSKSTLYRRLVKAGIERRPSDTNPSAFVYDVPAELVMSSDALIEWYRERGYVTAKTLAERTGLNAAAIRGRLALSNWPVAFRQMKGTCFYKDTPELMKVASMTRREMGLIRSDAKQRRVAESPPEEKPVEVREGDDPFVSEETSIDPGGKKMKYLGFMADLVREERRKRAWVGRMGRLVVDGHVVAEGIIESVSSCGVYLKGFKSKGDLNELELAEDEGGHLPPGGA